ncbi:MAG: TMEM43 family protein [Polyangiales bacterium]
MADNFTRSEHVSWFERIVDAIKGVLVGLLLFVVSFPLLFWNEGRAVRRAQDLEEGRGAVVEASASAVDPAHEGKLVHLTGPATTTETLTDEALGPVAAGALRLRRTVEMYQWVEHRETRTRSNTGGSQTRTTQIRYERAWRAEAIDSSQFDQPRDHANPPMPVRSHTLDARAVTVGARALTPSLISQIEGFRPLPVQPAQAPALAALGRPVRPHEAGLYAGADPIAPVIGDLRVRWEVAPAAPVTVLAAQQGNTFADWRTPSGRTLEQNLEMGAVSAAQMFTNLETGNVVLTWVLRFVGWLLMFAGISMVTRPLVVVADVLPFLGSLVGAGSGLFALLVSAPLSLLTVAMGWIAYRPLLGAGLLALGVGIAVVFGRLAAAKGAVQNAQRQAQRQAMPAR